MSESNCITRSPELMSVGDTCLMVVDVQERLIGSIAGWRKVVWNVRRLVDGAKALGVPIVATEQYPMGLGGTVKELSERLGDVYPDGIPEKMTFSSGGCPGVFEGLRDRGVRKILVTGIEAHVCVAQTVFDLIADGWRVYVAVDAVGSRFSLDYSTALARMDSAGATLTTTEAALFELCEVAGTPEFKEISRLVKECEPETEA
ncbi:MAG: isochorismatase family protein [Pirellulales bacterium]|nr:isochorismatase family protein [Pirellulales bacterium]